MNTGFSRLRANPFAFGLLLSLLSATAAGAVGALLFLLLDADRIGPSAAAGVLGMAMPWLFIYAVLVIPAIETLTGQLAPIEVLRWLKAPPAVGVVASAAVFAAGHFYSGGPGHGLTSFASGLVFACAYMAFRRESVGRAYACAWSAHAGHNAIFLALAP